MGEQVRPIFFTPQLKSWSNQKKQSLKPPAKQRERRAACVEHEKGRGKNGTIPNKTSAARDSLSCSLINLYFVCFSCRWSWINWLSSTSFTSVFFMLMSSWRSRSAGTSYGSQSASPSGTAPRLTTTFPSFNPPLLHFPPSISHFIDCYVFKNFPCGC